VTAGTRWTDGGAVGATAGWRRPCSTFRPSASPSPPRSAGPPRARARRHDRGATLPSDPRRAPAPRGVRGCCPGARPGERALDPGEAPTPHPSPRGPGAGAVLFGQVERAARMTQERPAVRRGSRSTGRRGGRRDVGVAGVTRSPPRGCGEAQGVGPTPLARLCTRTPTVARALACACGRCTVACAPDGACADHGGTCATVRPAALQCRDGDAAAALPRRLSAAATAPRSSSAPGGLRRCLAPQVCATVPGGLACADFGRGSRDARGHRGQFSSSAAGSPSGPRRWPSRGARRCSWPPASDSRRCPPDAVSPRMDPGAAGGASYNSPRSG
jgi:hypothetical protein